MQQFVASMFSLDVTSMTLVILICGWGFMITRAMMPIAGVAIATFPLLVLGALASRALLQDWDVVARMEKGPGLVLTTGIGMIAAVIVTVVVVRTVMMVHDALGRRPQLLDQQ